MSISKFVARLHDRGWRAYPPITYDHPTEPIVVRLWSKRNWWCTIACYHDLTHTIEFNRFRK